jgi:hypothetical protein
VLLLGVCLWRLAVPGVVQEWFKLPAALACLLLLLYMLYKARVTPSILPVRDVPNLWAVGGNAAGAAKQS